MPPGQLIAMIRRLRKGPNGDHLGPGERLTLLMLGYHWSPRLRRVDIGMSVLSQETGINQRDQRRIIRRLEDKGLITTRYRGVTVRGVTTKENSYYLGDLAEFATLTAAPAEDLAS